LAGIFNYEKLTKNLPTSYEMLRSVSRINVRRYYENLRNS